MEYKFKVEFNENLQRYIKNIDNNLKQYLPSNQHAPEVVVKAMDYSLLAGGKRLRPILLLEAAKCIGYQEEKAMPLACGMEMIHTYSLIHDDLPAMDNDDYRRGKLTNHKVFGEGMAILAGDSLLNYSFETMLNHVPINDNIEMINYIKAVQEIAWAAGVNGMIGGQVKDLECEGKIIDLETLKYIHDHKTGALIKASIRAGAIAADASENQLKNLTIFSEKIGLAFQIVDDILDVIGDEKKLGKLIGSDEKNHKMTYPSLYGLENSKKMVDELLQEALLQLKSFGIKGKFLGELAEFICKRDY